MTEDEPRALINARVGRLAVAALAPAATVLGPGQRRPRGLNQNMR